MEKPLSVLPHNEGDGESSRVPHHILLRYFIRTTKHLNKAKGNASTFIVSEKNKVWLSNSKAGENYGDS